MSRTSTQQRYAVEMDSGEEFVVRVTNPDRLRWDEQSKRQGWGPATESPFLAQTFVTWAAAKREGKTDLAWEQFKAHALDISTIEVDETDEVGPTPTVPGPTRS
jgi:hypothetical protein